MFPAKSLKSFWLKKNSSAASASRPFSSSKNLIQARAYGGRFFRIKPRPLHPKSINAARFDPVGADGKFAQHITLTLVKMVLQLFGVENPIFLNAMKFVSGKLAAR